MQSLAPPERRTMSVEEAAIALGIGRTTAYALARAGQLPGVLRFGRRLVISRAAVDQLLGGQAELAAPSSRQQPTSGGQ